ncbi:MAG: hypothetical protein WDM81_17005 [Rhizomicrobium sp.]
MAPRPPNYSQERTQRERAQRLKAEEKAQKRAEKSAKRKGIDAPPEDTDGKDRT